MYEAKRGRLLCLSICNHSPIRRLSTANRKWGTYLGMMIFKIARSCLKNSLFTRTLFAAVAAD